MIDTHQGAIRARAWPRKRPTKGSKDQQANREKFAQAQRSARYVAPEMLAYIVKATQNSPLLPRDVLTMLAFNRWAAFDLTDGRSLWPMPARTDVSEALDVLGTTEGFILRRGASFWEAVPLEITPEFPIKTPPKLSDFPLVVNSPVLASNQFGFTLTGTAVNGVIRAVFQDAPAAPWQADVCLTNMIGAGINSASIFLRNSTGAILETGLDWLNGNRTTVELWNNANSVGTNLNRVTISPSGFPTWLRTVHDPTTNLTSFSISYDGLLYFPIFSTSAFGPATNIGIGCGFRNFTVPPRAGFSSFKVVRL